MDKKTQLNMWYVSIAIFVILLLQSWLMGRGAKVIPYSEFEQLLKDNQIQEVYVRQDYLEGKSTSQRYATSNRRHDFSPPTELGSIPSWCPRRIDAT